MRSSVLTTPSSLLIESEHSPWSPFFFLLFPHSTLRHPSLAPSLLLSLARSPPPFPPPPLLSFVNGPFAPASIDIAEGRACERQRTNTKLCRPHFGAEAEQRQRQRQSREGARPTSAHTGNTVLESGTTARHRARCAEPRHRRRGRPSGGGRSSP